MLVLIDKRELIAGLVRKELITRYNDSMLGIFWMQIRPLFLLILYTFLFIAIFRVEIPYYPLFLCVGMSLFFFCANSLQKATTSIVSNDYLVSRVYFPSEALPISMVVVSFIDLMASSIVILLITLAYGIRPMWSWVTLLPLTILLGIIIAGIGLVLATIAVYLRDVRWIVDVGSIAIMHLSPVFWREDMVPDSLHWMISINPLAVTLIAFREALIQGVWPSNITFGVLLCESVVAIWFGFLVFGRWQPGFADVV